MAKRDRSVAIMPLQLPNEQPLSNSGPWPRRSDTNAAPRPTRWLDSSPLPILPLNRYGQDGGGNLNLGKRSTGFFPGRCRRRPRCDSCLSFQSWIRRPSSHPGGDPFSHPSGFRMSRPVWVPAWSAARGRSATRSARPPPGLPGARKHPVPNRVHSVGKGR